MSFPSSSDSDSEMEYSPYEYSVSSAQESYFPPSAFGQYRRNRPLPTTSYFQPNLFRILELYKQKCHLCDEELKSEHDIIRCSQCSYMLCHACLNNLYGDRKCPGCRQLYSQYHYLPQRTPPPPSPMTPLTFQSDYSYDLPTPSPVRYSPLPSQSEPVVSDTPYYHGQQPQTYHYQPIPHTREPSPLRLGSPIRYMDDEKRELPPSRDLFSYRYDYIPEESPNDDDVIYISSD